MRHLITIMIIINLISISGYSQTDMGSARILSENEINEIFTNDLKSDLGINFPIFRIYNYIDNSGEFFIVLTENEYKIEDDKPLKDSIKGFCIQKSNMDYSVVWQMKDFIVKENKADTPEYSIWFWTKYYKISDFDKDGLIDPIMVYGTSGINGTEDGKIKILVYYKNIKYGIRHQNGTLDSQRNTQVDTEFYNLPIQIQTHVRGLIEKMIENNHAIFPHGYKENMDSKKTYFDEN